MPELTATVADLAAGRTSAQELVRAALAAADLWGAYERRLPDALDAARAADTRRAAGRALSPLDGIPFAVKANLDVAGVPSTAGTGLRRPAAAADAAVVAALRVAGAVPVATATLAEGALGAVTDNPHTGPCRNPRDPTRNAGGSSGGSAAAVAAGLAPFALGTDTMGSVRIPAAYCGVTGLKPSRDGLPVGGLVPLAPWLDTVGVLADRVADVAVVLDALAPAAARRTTSSRYAAVGVPDLAERADAAGRAALHRAAAVLESDGCEVRREVRLGVDPATVRRRGLLLCEAGGYAAYRSAVDADDTGLSEAFKALLRYGAAAKPARLRSARRELEAGAEVVRAAMSELDALLLPVTPGPPPPLGEDPSDAADLTAWVNACGLPAVALPAASPVNGPVPGLQLVGRPGTERELLTLAARLEARLRQWN